MRLNQQQVQLLITALTPFIKLNQAELRLFGSRVDDNAKGGDIDLLLLLQDTHAAEQLAEEKYKILAAIKKYLGDQKIDLKIATTLDIQQDSFLQIILPTSIILHHWK